MWDSSARPWTHWDDIYKALGGGGQNMKLAGKVDARALPAETYALDPGIPGDPHNPSVAIWNGHLVAIVRVLNKATYHTTNVLGKVVDRAFIPSSVLRDVACGVTSRGHEDCRLFVLDDALMISATVCNKDQTVGFARPRMTVAQVAGGSIKESVPFASLRQEKNWMPCVEGSRLRFVYSVDPLIVLRYDDATGEVSPRAAELPDVSGTIRGGSQLIPYRDGWLAVVHQAHKEAGIIYTHRFAVFDKALTKVSIGAPFYFLKRGIEFCAGLALWKDKYILSFGLEDKQALIAEVTPETVEELLKDASTVSSCIPSVKEAPLKVEAPQERVGVFVTHYLPKENWRGLNEILFDQVTKMHASTNLKYDLRIVYYAEDVLGEAHLRSLLPDICILSDRGPRPDIQPALRNKVLDLAKGYDVSVLLHNDARPARYWLERFLQDLREGEKQYGRGSVIVSPRAIPYHYVSSELAEDVAFWERLRDSTHVRSIEQMRPWCKLWQFAMDGEEVICPAWAPAPDTGHALMMWCTRPEFFDAVGPCDEAFVGGGLDDIDWGMRALKAGKKSLMSQSALVGHIEGLTFNANPRLSNEDVFRAKWGEEITIEMFTGRIWQSIRGK